MPRKKTASIVEHFAILVDPRIDRTKRHSLHDIIVIAICGMICGADDWVAIQEFGEAREDWFRTFLDLPSGIPSHDTFGRVFAALDPEAFSRCFAAWMRDVAELTDGEVVAIDGKTIRRSFDRASSRNAIHIVSAWAAENGVAIGQVKTDAKSNEITAIPRLLEMLHVKGCIVTIDAMGCQKEIASKILEKEADYLLGLKGNQPQLEIEVAAYFDAAIKNKFVGVPHGFHETTERGHGRVERRRVWCTTDVGALASAEAWPGLASIIRVEAERTIGGKKSVECRHFISSMKKADARKAGSAVREHWGIENKHHWILDIAFREDDSRSRVDNSAQNLATLRHIALNLLKSDTYKLGVKNKRLKAGWDIGYLLKLLGIAK